MRRWGEQRPRRRRRLSVDPPATNEDEKGRRVRLPAHLHDELSDWAAAHGLDDDEVLQLVLQAFRPLNEDRAAAAAAVVERLARADTLTVDQLQLPEANVIGVRLGGKRVDNQVVPGGLAPRPFIGTDLGDTLEEVYSAARGYWRARGDGEYLVGIHVGEPLAAFKVERWAKLSSGRIFVADGEGARIDTGSGKLVDPVTGAVIGPASALDLDVAKALEGVLLRFPQGSVNPVVWLRRRS